MRPLKTSGGALQQDNQPRSQRPCGRRCRDAILQARVTAALAADGTITLTVNDAAPITDKALRLIPRQPTENFCLGHDDSRPATTYRGKEPFKGGIRGLKVTTP